MTPITTFKKHIDHDPDLERAVLGVCTLEQAAFGSVYGMLTAECFFTHEHLEVYNAMEQLWKDGHPVELLSLSRTLYERGINTLGGHNTTFFLTQLSRDVVNTAYLQRWCMQLRELAARRTMITLTSSGLRGDDVNATAQQIQQAIQKALEIKTADDWQDAAHAGHALMQHMDAVQGQEMIGISTTFPQIDKLNGGFRPGQLIIIGARPSVGKSALMGSIAIQAAKEGRRVGVISLEMPAKDIFGRMVSADSGAPFTAIDRNRIYEEQQRKDVHQSINTLSALPISFSDGTQVNIHDIRAKAEQLKRRHGLDLLILDYLQLVDELPGNSRSREQGISQISRGLKMLAMTLEIPVIALSQLNRESEHRANKRPSVADLRESGAIEQDADIIMLLHRDWRCGIYTDAQGQSTEHQADLIVAKWRNGTPMDLKLHFTPGLMKFSEFME